MKLKALALSMIFMVSAWGNPSIPKPSDLTLSLLKSQGWTSASPEDGEWAAWVKDSARISYRPWQAGHEGEPWKIGSKTAQFILGEDNCALGSQQGWSYQAAGLSNPAQVFADLATTLSSNGSVQRVVSASTLGRPIETIQIGSGPHKVLFFAVFHGDEPAGEVALRRLNEYLLKNPSLLKGNSILICPVLNPDGLAAGTRVNANSVDVNRNFPAKNWSGEGKGERYWGGPEAESELETRVAMQIVEDFAPKVIVSIHAPLRNVNYDGPAAKLAKRMSKLNGYPVEPDIGYPTPGSFGTYYGRERSIPVITLEFPEGDGNALWLENKEALLEAIRYDKKP